MLHLNGILRGGVGQRRRRRSARAAPNLLEVRRRVGIVFQDPDDQLFMPTVRDDVGFGPANLGVRGAELAARVATRARTRSAMADHADRPPHHLSFGQRRRVAVATVLAMEPEILVLDEPTSNLDPASRRELADIIRSLDVTTLLVTHDLPYALELCPRSVVLSDGRVVADGADHRRARRRGAAGRAPARAPVRLRPGRCTGARPDPPQRRSEPSGCRSAPPDGEDRTAGTRDTVRRTPPGPPGSQREPVRPPHRDRAVGRAGSGVGRRHPPPAPSSGVAAQPLDAEIERDIEATRARLAASIDELADRVSPKNVAKRGADKARLTVVDETGAPRTGRLAAVGAAVAAVVGIVLWRRRD